MGVLAPVAYRPEPFIYQGETNENKAPGALMPLALGLTPLALLQPQGKRGMKRNNSRADRVVFYRLQTIDYSLSIALERLAGRPTVIRPTGFPPVVYEPQRLGNFHEPRILPDGRVVGHPEIKQPEAATQLDGFLEDPETEIVVLQELRKEERRSKGCRGSLDKVPYRFTGCSLFRRIR